MALNTASGTGVVVWAYRNDYNSWSAYEPKVSQEIEKVHSRRTQSRLNLGSIVQSLSCYEIDLQNLTQVQLNTGKFRQIQRQVHPPNSALANKTIWEFEGDHAGQWFMYDLETLEHINDAFLKCNQGASPIFDLIKMPYKIDLQNFVQIRINTGTKRKIRHRVLNESYSADTTSGMPSFTSVTLPIPSFPGGVNGSSQAVVYNGKSKSRSGAKHHPYNNQLHHSKVSFQHQSQQGSSLGPSLGLQSIKSQAQTASQMHNPNVLHQPFQRGIQSIFNPLTLPQLPVPLASLPPFPGTHHGYHPLQGVTAQVLQSMPQPLTESLPSSVKITIKNKACKSMSGLEVLGRYMTRVHTDLDKTDCAICCDKLSEASSYGDGQPEAYEAIQLSRCSHQFHKLCLLTMYNSSHKDDSLQCPSCKMIYGEKTGICPPGYMNWKILAGHSLAGYEGYNTICVTYHLSSGIQGPEHPQPGQPYTCRGFPRQGFLPDCDKGRKVLKLLMEAFRRRLMFTIGTSHTTGEPNTVTWNEIHHKTEPHGNQSGHGYPDPNYLENVLQELAAYGITDDCLTKIT